MNCTKVAINTYAYSKNLLGQMKPHSSAPVTIPRAILLEMLHAPDRWRHAAYGYAPKHQLHHHL